MGKIEELSILIKKNLILEEEYLRNIRLDKENRNEIEKENLDKE